MVLNELPYEEYRGWYINRGITMPTQGIFEFNVYSSVAKLAAEESDHRASSVAEAKAWIDEHPIGLKYQFHGTAYDFDGLIMETDDFGRLPDIDMLRKWAINVAKQEYGELGGFESGQKMPVDKIEVTGPEGYRKKWSMWELFG